MISKIDKIYKYSIDDLKKYLGIKDDDLLNDKRFQNFLKKYENELDSIDISNYKKIYEETGIKIKRIFKSKKDTLEIDLYTVDYHINDKECFIPNRYKSRIISEIEKQINEKYKLIERKDKLDKNDEDYDKKRLYYFDKIDKIDKYINRLDKDINTNLDVITYVDKISINNNKIILKNKFRKYILDTSKIFKEDEFNGKYPCVLEIIDGNYVVNTLTKEKAEEVEYCAYTEIDQVYGLEGKWGLVDKDDNVIIKPKYIYPFIECGDNLQVMLPYEYKKIDGVLKVINLKHGLIDKKGKILIPIKYLEMNSIDTIR